MSPCRISKLEIQGFRSFGRDVQTLEFPQNNFRRIMSLL